MLIVYDKQANAALPTGVSQILLAANVNSPLNLDNRKRFHIIHDETWVFDPYISTASTQLNTHNQVHFVKLQKYLNLKTVFNATSAENEGEIASGALIWVIADAGSSVIEFNANFKVFFVDL
jgi:hypothetical protein